MTRTVATSRRQIKRPSAIPRFSNKIQKSKTPTISAVVKATCQGRNHSKKPQTKSVRFAGLQDKSIKISPKTGKESSVTSWPVNNSHIGDDFVFEADPDALASILNNDGVTREQLIKSHAAETANKEQSADEYLLVDGRPSLCRRVPIKRAAGVLPDGRPSLISARVSVGPARVERPSVSGRTSLMKKGSVAPSFGRDSLYSFIEQKYSQRLQLAHLEHTQRRTTIASTACQNLSHGTTLKDRTNKPEIHEPQRVMSTKKVAPTTPATRVLVAANPVLGSPALRVRQSGKKTPVKSRLALARSPEMKENVITALDFRDDENASPNIQSKVSLSKKQNIPAQVKSRSKLQRPLTRTNKQPSGIIPPGGAATKSKLPPRNSDRYSFIRKPAPSKVPKDPKLNSLFSPINLKSGEELVEPKTINEGKPRAFESKSKPKQAARVQVRIPAVLNSEQRNLKPMGPDQLVLASRDANDNVVGQLQAAESKLKSPKRNRVSASRLPSKKVIDADTMLEMLKQRMKTIKRRSVQTEFCSVITSMEKEMALTSVAEEPNDNDMSNKVEVSSPGHDKAEISQSMHDKVEVSPQSNAQATQMKAADTLSSQDIQGSSWHNILKSDKSPTWKAILEKETQAGKAGITLGKSDEMPPSDTKPPTWKDVLKQDVVSTPLAEPQSSAKNSTLIPTGGTENLRRLLGSEAKRDAAPVSTLKGHGYNKGVGLGITRERFLNILSYNPSPAVKLNTVSATSKFFQPVPDEVTSDSSNLMATEELKNDGAVFVSLKSEDGKFFPDSRLNVQGSCESEKLTSVQEESQDQTVHQQVDNERPIGGTSASNSVQWVEKTPGVSRYETNRARIVDPSQSPESPEFDFTKSLFWVEKTPASHNFKMAPKDLASTAESSRQVASQAENSCEILEPGITCKENETDVDIQFSITSGSNSTISPSRDLCEPSIKYSNLRPDKAVVDLYDENEELYSAHTEPSSATMGELQEGVQEQKGCLGDDQPKRFSRASWSKKYGPSQQKISSGRLRKDATKIEECSVMTENIPIVRVFSPKVASPQVPTTSPSTDNLRNSRKLHPKSGNSFNQPELPNVIQSHKHVSPAVCSNSPTYRRKVRFSDVVTHIVCLDSDEVVSGLSTPLPSTSARSQNSCDRDYGSKQPRDGCEATLEKLSMDNMESLKDYNPADLDLSFLDSLHVVAIETKNDAEAKMSMLPKPQREEAPSALPVTRTSQTSSLLTTQSLPAVANDSCATAITTMHTDAQPAASTLPGSGPGKRQISTISSDAEVNVMFSKAKDAAAIEKASLTHQLSVNSEPETVPCSAKTLQMCATLNPLCCTKTEDNNMQDKMSISQASCTQSDNINIVPSTFLTGIGGLYSFAGLENRNDTSAEKSLLPLHSRMLCEGRASSPLLVNHTPRITSTLTSTDTHSVPCLIADDSVTAEKGSTKHAVQSNLDPIPSALPTYRQPSATIPQVYEPESDDIVTSGKIQSHSLMGSSSFPLAVSITNPVLPDFKCDTLELSPVVVKESSYPRSLPSVYGNTAINSTILHAPRPTPLKPRGLLPGGKDSPVKSATTGFQSAVPIAAPKPIFPPAPQTPAAFRQLRRKLQESPVPKTFRSRCSPLKSSAFGGVRKTPQKRVRFASSSPYTKSLCSKRFTEALLDEEVALLTCRRFRSPGTPSKKRRSRVARNPLGRVLLDGDDSHFVPISPMDINKKPSAASGSAFSVFKQ